MDINSAITFLEQHGYFDKIDLENINKIKKYIKIHHFSNNEIIIKEGDKGHSIYILVEGDIAILSKNSLLPENENFELVSFRIPGMVIGEASQLYGGIRSTTVQAKSSVRIIEIQTEQLRLMELWTPFMSNIFKKSIEKFGKNNEKIVGLLITEINLNKLLFRNGLFIVYFFLAFSVANVISAISSKYNISLSRGFLWSYLLIMLIPIIIYVFKTKLNIAQYGVTFDNLSISIKEGLLISILATSVFFGAIYLYSVINHKPLHAIINFNYFGIAQPLYLLHSYIQEFLARGVLQTSIEEFLVENSSVMSIVVASAIFAALHINFGLYFMIATFVGGIFFGLIYIRHKNLIGVSLVHYSVGALFQSLLS